MTKEKKATSKKTVKKVNAVAPTISKAKKENGISPVNIVAIIGVLIIFGLIGLLSSQIKTTHSNQITPTVAAVQAIAYDGEDGKNALDLLKSKAEIETQDSSIGVFVISINGVSNSEDHFWMFYINNELAQVNADQYTTTNNDKIEWRYEQFN